MVVKSRPMSVAAMVFCNEQILCAVLEETDKRGRLKLAKESAIRIRQVTAEVRRMAEEKVCDFLHGLLHICDAHRIRIEGIINDLQKI